MESSKSIFIGNLLSYIAENGYGYSQGACSMRVNMNTLKGWLSGKRTPTLSNLDKLATYLGVYSYELISPGFSISHHNAGENNSHTLFSENLRILFTTNQCYLREMQLAMLDNVITKSALVSYLRKVNYKQPTFEKLDSIARVLGINAFMLIKKDGVL